MRSHWILNVRVDDISDNELAETLRAWLAYGETRLVVTPNPEMILEARRDSEFQDVLNRADLNLPDGVGLKFAVPVLAGRPLSYRHTGVDTLFLLAKLCAHLKKSMVFLGGEDGVAQAAARTMAESCSGLRVTAIDPGKIHLEDRGDGARRRLVQIAEQAGNASVIAVGLGQGKQERFMEQLAAVLESSPRPRILIGVGGAFDMISGTKRRAPVLVRRFGFEWAWRLAIEPSRWRRIARAVIVFPLAVAFDTLLPDRRTPLSR